MKRNRKDNDHVRQDIPEAREVRALVLLLWGGYQRARALRRPLEEFGWDMDLLRHSGIDEQTVQDALARSYVEWSAKNTARQKDTALNPSLPRLILTESGSRWAEKLTQLSIGDIGNEVLGRGRPRRKPHWDARTGELRFHGERLLRLRRRGTNQWRLISAFQEAHWYWRIDNPWPLTDRNRAERLAQTARDLNRAQDPVRLHFLAEVNGEGVRWSIVGEEEVNSQRAPE